MDDQEYNELLLRVSICPSMERWPHEYRHWALMRAAATEAPRPSKKSL